jgi:hypothetical protein
MSRPACPPHVLVTLNLHFNHPLELKVVQVWADVPATRPGNEVAGNAL